MDRIENILVTDDKSLLQMETICSFLKRTNWASKRSKETIEKSVESSLCFGAYHEGKQIAFARVITDGCTFAYLCDVFVEEKYRGQGISKALMEKIMDHQSLQNLRRFVLATEDAHGLYEKFGFKSVPANFFMQIMNDDI